MLAAEFGPSGEFVLGGGGFQFAGEAADFVAEGVLFCCGGGVGGWEEGEEVPCLLRHSLAGCAQYVWVGGGSFTRSLIVCLPTVLIMWMRSWRMKTRSKAEIMMGNDPSWSQRRSM